MKNILMLSKVSITFLFLCLLFAGCDNVGGGGPGGGSTITNNAFNYTGSYPSPALISYIDKSGESSQTYAYPGQVQLFAKQGVPDTNIITLINSKGGTIIGKIPFFGYYLVNISTNQENTFISAVNSDSSVEFAIPNSVIQVSDVIDLSAVEGPNGELPVVPNLKAQVANGVYLYGPDDYVNPTLFCNGSPIAHGTGTSYVASQGLSSTGQQINIFNLAGTSTKPNDIVAANTIALQDLTYNGTGRAVVNLSLQGAYEDQNKIALPDSVYRANERNLLRNYAQQLNVLAQKSPRVFQNVVFVISSGNGVADAMNNGLDLTKEIQDLHRDFPLVFPQDGSHHMLIVGATQLGSNAVDIGANYSTVNGDIVYAPGHQVQVSSSGCTADGTSFAAPAVANLIASILASRPNATVSDITKAFMNAYAQKGYVLPTVEDVLGANCSYVISPTSRSIGASGGSGSVTVTTVTGCSWTAASNAAWITVTSGSSHTGSGTVGYSVQANTNPVQRIGSMTIAGKTFSITQSPQVQHNEVVTYGEELVTSGDNCWACIIHIQISNAAPGASVTVSSSWGNSASGTINSSGTASIALQTAIHCPCLSGSFSVYVNGDLIDTESSDCF